MIYINNIVCIHIMIWRFISDSIIFAFPLMLLISGSDAFLVILYCGVISLCNELIKVLTRVRRPDKSDYLSFPSNHSNISMFIALFYNLYPLYLWSFLIGYSRYKLKRHSIYDILFGFIFAFFWIFFYQKSLSFLYLI